MSTTVGLNKVPTFSGKKEDYLVWWTKFQAYCAQQGYSDALDPGFVSKLPADDATPLDETNSDEKKQADAKKMNLKAMAAFATAFETARMLILLHKVKTDKWSDGLACELVKKLKGKFVPSKENVAIESTLMMNEIKMGYKDDPSTLFEQMSEIEILCADAKKHLDEDTMVGFVLKALPTQYANCVVQLKNDCKRDGVPITLDALEEKVVELWRTLNPGWKKKGGTNHGSEQEGEVALGSVSDKKCFKCNKVGHIAKFCPQKGGNNNNNQRGTRFQGKCNNCGKTGHKAVDCWDDPKNSGKRPDWWKNKSEMGAVSVNREIQLVSFDNKPVKEMFCKEVQVTKSVSPVVKKKLFWADWEDEDSDEESDDDDVPPPSMAKDLNYHDSSDDEISCGSIGTLECDNQQTNLPNELKLPSVSNREQGKCTYNSILHHPNIWIVDSGATMHSTGCTIGMTDLENGPGITTTVGNGHVEKSKKQGNLPVKVCDRLGQELQDAKLNQVQVLKSPFNLLSVSQLLKQGFKMSGNASEMVFQKGKCKLVCDIKVQTNKGFVFAIMLKRRQGPSSVRELTNLSYQELHDMYAHCNERETRKIADHFGIPISKESAKPCESCAVGKAKQKNVINKNPDKKLTFKATEPNGRVYLDVSSVKAREGAAPPPKPHWRIIVDEKTQHKTSGFYATKDGMVEPTCELMSQWRQQDMPVKHLRMDNGGENIALEKRLKSSDWQLHPIVEYTAKDTPQHNHLAEVSFSTLSNRFRAMMHRANIPSQHRLKVWHKAASVATKMDGLTVIEIDGVKKTRVEHWSGKLPGYAHYLRTWGEAGVVKVKRTGTPKVADRGITCMFVDYADNHAGDCYEMLNLQTMRILLTRDVQWLGRMYYQQPQKEATIAPLLTNQPNPFAVLQTNDDDSDSDEEPSTNQELPVVSDTEDDPEEDQEEKEQEEENEEVEDDESSSEASTLETVRRRGTVMGYSQSGRSVRRPTTLQYSELGGVKLDMIDMEFAFHQAELSCITRAKTLKETNELANVGATGGGGYQNTEELHVKNYEQAMNGPDKESWLQAIYQEYLRMLKHKVFKAIRKDQVPRDAMILSGTWAMKQKSNGDKRARITARGFEQIEGEHYSKDHIQAPVVNEATIFIVLILIVMAGYKAELMDVSAAFLNGVFTRGERLFMHVPKGFEQYYPKDVYLLLQRTIYGLKQAAYEYWRMLLKAIRSIGMERSKGDPCLYFRWTENGLQLWTSWVDDLLNVGRDEDVQQAKQAFKQYFDIDEIGDMNEYVGCKIEHNKEQRYIKITQPVLVQSLRDEFELPGGATPTTPAAPGTILTEGETKLGSAKHSKYRSGVGKLIHLSKFSRPDVLNAVREVSRYSHGPTAAHEAAMLRIMKFVLGTAEKGLVLKPDTSWDGSKDFQFTIAGKSDSDFGKDPKTRRSVSGVQCTLNGAPFVQKSMMQKFVTTSVTEAELVAGTECVQGMLFGMRLLESIGLQVKKPMNLQMDNKGAVDLVNGWSISGNTRAIAVRLAYLRELKEQGILSVQWIPSDENSADLFTKNLDSTSFAKHSATIGID